MRTRSLIKNNSKSRAIILHLDGDPKYARKAYSYYNNLNLKAIVENVPEYKQHMVINSLLNKYNIVGTPGVGFGPSGEGYFRLTAFGDREKTIEAMKRMSL